MGASINTSGVSFTSKPASDYFWSGSSFLSSNWTVIDRAGDASNSESQGYSPGNVFVNGSNYLEIVSEKVTSHGQAYRSGMIQFSPGFTFTHGTIEARVKFPAGTGPWPAIWLLGYNCQSTNPTTADNVGACSWPNISAGSDEIDFVEFIGSNRTSLNFQVHNENGNDQVTPALGFNASSAFHKYKLVRISGSITLFVDDVQIAQITSHVSDTPMGLIINTAVGGNGGGAITDGTLPVSMLIDYVSMTVAA